MTFNYDAIVGHADWTACADCKHHGDSGCEFEGSDSTDGDYFSCDDYEAKTEEGEKAP